MNPSRAKLIQLIHVGKSKLGLDDELYRQLLHTVTGLESCSLMTVPQLEAVLNHLQIKGFTPVTGKGHPGRPKNIDCHPQLKKIEAQLADLKLPWGYARSIAMRQCGKVLEFCNPSEWTAVIAALAARQAKESKGEQQ